MQLWQPGDAHPRLDPFADVPPDPAVPAKILAADKHMPPEALALDGSSRGYTYRSLLTLSNRISRASSTINRATTADLR